MLKIEIEGIELHYKNVSDLNAKVESHLRDVRLKKAQATEELKTLSRKERSLKRFLGIDAEDNPPEVRKAPLI
jgi:hypothetical protein